MLHEFFAVTESGSLYRVQAERDASTSCPIVEKIGGPSPQPLQGGMPLNGRLTGGTMIGVSLDSSHGLVVFTPNDRYGRDFWRQNMGYWGGGTSPLIGLFLQEDAARRCLEALNRVHRDPRWEKQTEEVVKAIGDDHSAFVVAPHSPFSTETPVGETEVPS